MELQHFGVGPPPTIHDWRGISTPQTPLPLLPPARFEALLPSSFLVLSLSLRVARLDSLSHLAIAAKMRELGIALLVLEISKSVASSVRSSVRSFRSVARSLLAVMLLFFLLLVFSFPSLLVRTSLVLLFPYSRQTPRLPAWRPPLGSVSCSELAGFAFSYSLRTNLLNNCGIAQ